MKDARSHRTRLRRHGLRSQCERAGARRSLDAEHGLETLELVLITALMMIVLVAGIPLLGDGLTTALGGVAQALSDAADGIPTN